MCGLAGSWGSFETETVRRMMHLLRHRGPDAGGMYLSPERSGVLGHRRLSIMDPEGGDQPICDEAGSRALIANGEIYNFPQLRQELAPRHRFRTKSDSEAVLHLYEEEGPAAVEKLDGMYAFALADGQELFAARDPLGIKPLYYGEKEGGFFFASELKALASCCRTIREFPPGSFFHTARGLSTFYTVPELGPEKAPLERHLAQIRQTLEGAVGKRLMSDVPLGAFLSGGLDSSIIAALARKHLDQLHTFSVGVEGSPDLEAARLVARHLETTHHEYVLTPAEVQNKLPEIIYYLESFDQDLVRSAIPCYFTSRLAAEYVKVILTGEGADELFAGYSYYQGIRGQDDLQRELRRSVRTLHNINLQRVDRMTMAHSLEGRVPFLDLEMIQLGQRIPAVLKLRPEDGREKWVLRKAFADLLPPEIVWRKKAQFDQGSGTVELLGAEGLVSLTTEEESLAYRRRFPEARLRSAEEAHYHRLFLEVFEDPSPILKNVGRWAERPALAS